MKSKKTFFKGVVLTFSMLALGACNDIGMEGSWVEPVPGMPNMEQGFTLESDGKAISINMATLRYEGWEQNGDRLILSGKSIGNRQTISFSDTLVIENLTPDKLTLEHHGAIRQYSRKE